MRDYPSRQKQAFFCSEKRAEIEGAFSSAKLACPPPPFPFKSVHFAHAVSGKLGDVQITGRIDGHRDHPGSPFHT